MAQIFVSPWTQYQDASGNPGSGDLLYFYTTGTTTPITIYSDSGLTTPQANPVVADSAGQWAAVYFVEALVKVVMKSAAGVTIRSADPAFVNTLDNTVIGGTTPAAGNFTTISGTGITPITLTYTDSGAAAGPNIDFVRNSTTPAANDLIASINFKGEDSAANTETYGYVSCFIDDPTNGSEDGGVSIGGMAAGVSVTTASFTPSGGMSLKGNATDFTVARDADTKQLSIRGGLNFATSAVIQLYGGTHATRANDIHFSANNTDVYAYVHASLQHRFLVADVYTAGTSRFGQNSTDVPGGGNNTVGGAIASGGAAFFSSASAPVTANRTVDGIVFSGRSGGTEQCSISIAGATGTFNAFLGAHWAQLADGSRLEIRRGMIVESIDLMSEWPGEEPEERLPRFRISDTPQSKRVVGVFGFWDNDWEATNDAINPGVGFGWVLIAPGEKVEGGDLIVSSDVLGCGRVQSDDIIRSCTVGKITAAIAVESHEDGSKLYPCAIYCG